MNNKILGGINNGNWRIAFEQSMTKDKSFHSVKGTQKCKMMSLKEEYLRYYSDKSLQIVELPYKSSINE